MRLPRVRFTVRRLMIGEAFAAIVLPLLIASPLPTLADDKKGAEGRLLPAKNEVVMTPGMLITATTTAGTITVTAVDELTRSYTWERATRSVEMVPRPQRWYGSLGLFYPGPGEHWAEHHGITRGVLEEGQQHFKSVEEAMKWVKDRTWIPLVYRDDGLLVGFGKTLPRKQLNVDVWQILINGKKPERLPGSQNDKITVETVQTDTSPLVRAVKRNDSKAVADLLARGADPKTKDSVGTPVLILAAKRGSGAIVEALLKKGADPNVRDEAGSTALLEAVDKERAEVVRILLAGGADVNASETRSYVKGTTPLMVAVLRGSDPLVQTLVDKGADLEAVGDLGLTALGLARVLNKEAIIRRLQKTGAKK
jgi:hypothetical protein